MNATADPAPGTTTARDVASREPYVAGRVLNALLREDYGGMASLLTRDKAGVALVLASGRRVRLSPGALFQDFVLAPTESVSLGEVLETLETIADPADAVGVAAFTRECRETLATVELYDLHREAALVRLLRREPGASGERSPRSGTAGGDSAVPSGVPSGVPNGVRSAPSGNAGASSDADVVGHSPIFYDALAAAVDHPVYPTARCRLGLSAEDMLAYAPEFAPEFDLRWAAVPNDVVRLHGLREAPWATWATWWPKPSDVGLPDRLLETHTLFPVHPLTVAAVQNIPGVIVSSRPCLTVRPTLSMRTVEVDRRTHLKLPLATSTLGLRNRRSIKPATLHDAALAESLLREVLRREPDLRVSLAGEQRYGHADHEYLGWMVRDLPEGEIVTVAALLAPLPGRDPSLRHRLSQGRGQRLSVPAHLAARFYGGPRSEIQGRAQTRLRDLGGSTNDAVRDLLRDYLTMLFALNVRLFVRYGIALEAHQQNLALVFGDGPPRLLVKDNDGLIVSSDRLRAAGLDVPHFTDGRMLSDDPHAIADVFVTITLHLAAAAVAFGVLAAPGNAVDRARQGAAELVRDALARALDTFGDHPMARLLRARTLEADRLVGKSMVTAATLMDKERSGARDVNKFYGTSGPNYLRHPHL